MVTHDAIVVGGGPAGLGAALAVARGGGRVALVDAEDTVGGLCRTFRRDVVAYDLGGHILFVDGERRRQWLEDLLDGQLIWVDRPVACILDGQVRRGRYLDQTATNPTSSGDDPSAEDFVASRYGDTPVASALRGYLQKVDGLPVALIAAARPRRLWQEQSAPDGFWYPTEGVGALMDSMAREIRRAGGEVLCERRVTTIDVAHPERIRVAVEGPLGEQILSAPRVVAALPPPVVARLVLPAAPSDVHPSLPARAAVVVYLRVDRDRVSDEPWIQVADPTVPFSRLFEMKNWSDRLVPAGQTILGCEVYCSPSPADPWWSLSDAALGAACETAVRDALGLVPADATVELVEVVRRPRAWSVAALPDLAAAMLPTQWLAGIDGLTVAQGGDLMRAIAAGEDAAVNGT